MNSLAYYKRIFSSYLFNKGQNNLSFWHTPLMVNPFSGKDRGDIRRYPMNFAEKTKYNAYHDADGVIMLNYGGELGIKYNPNAIAQAALGHYDLYLDALASGEEGKQKEHTQAFLRHAEWFMRHGRMVGGNVWLWEYEFSFECRDPLVNPWRSALAQGQAISVIIRAYLLTHAERYLHRARQGFNAFRHSGWEHEGGVIFSDGASVWLEEFILRNPNHVLNGWVWALWGVRDYAVYFKDEYAQWLYQASEMTLRGNLVNYDLGFWTCYDDKIAVNKPIMPVSSYYQTLHYTQMLGMYELTGDEVYKHWYGKWRGYYENPLYRISGVAWKSYFKLRYW